MTQDTWQKWIGQQVIVTLNGGAQVCGRFAGIEDDELIVVENRAGDQFLVRQHQVGEVVEWEQAPRLEGGDHQLLRFVDQIPDREYYDSLSIHEAAHAVIARIVGLDVVRVSVARNRQDLHGGDCDLGSGDAQLQAVSLVAGALAQTAWLAKAGYGSRLTAAAVEQILGQGDRLRLAQMAAGGFVVYLRQAIEDAEVLLRQPQVWAALTRVAGALHQHGQQTGHEVDELIGPDVLSSEGSAWSPSDKG